MKSQLILFTFCLLLITAGCSKDDNGNGTPPVDYSGTWQGTWTSSVHISSGTFSVNLSQDGNDLSGTITIPGISLINAPLSGKVIGERISFGDIDEIISFTGNRDNDLLISGSYIYPGESDNGSWEAAKEE